MYKNIYPPKKKEKQEYLTNKGKINYEIILIIIIIIKSKGVSYPTTIKQEKRQGIKNHPSIFQAI